MFFLSLWELPSCSSQCGESPSHSSFLSLIGEIGVILHVGVVPRLSSIPISASNSAFFSIMFGAMWTVVVGVSFLASLPGGE